MKALPAKLVSWVLDPTVVTVAAVALLGGTKSLTAQVGGVIFMGVGGLLPAMVLVYQYYNTITNRVVDRKERNEVFTAGVIGFSLAAIVFASGLFTHRGWMLISMATASYFAITLYVNVFFDKLSQHTGIFTFWTMALVGQLSNAYGLMFGLLPLIMWSRLSLKKHTRIQLVWGVTVGLLTGLLTWVT